MRHQIIISLFCLSAARTAVAAQFGAFYPSVVDGGYASALSQYVPSVGGLEELYGISQPSPYLGYGLGAYFDLPSTQPVPPMEDEAAAAVVAPVPVEAPVVPPITMEDIMASQVAPEPIEMIPEVDVMPAAPVQKTHKYGFPCRQGFYGQCKKDKWGRCIQSEIVGVWEVREKAADPYTDQRHIYQMGKYDFCKQSGNYIKTALQGLIESTAYGTYTQEDKNYFRLKDFSFLYDKKYPHEIIGSVTCISDLKLLDYGKGMSVVPEVCIHKDLYREVVKDGKEYALNVWKKLPGPEKKKRHGYGYHHHHHDGYGHEKDDHYEEDHYGPHYDDDDYGHHEDIHYDEHWPSGKHGKKKGHRGGYHDDPYRY